MYSLGRRKGASGGGAAASNTVTMGTAADATDWAWVKEPGTNNRLVLKKGSIYYASFDPTLTPKFIWAPLGDLADRTLSIEAQTAGSGWKTGVRIRGTGLTSGGRLILAAGSGLGAGEGVCVQAYNAAAGLVRTVIDTANAAAEPTLSLCEDGAQIFKIFGATGTVQGTGGAATAGATWDATSQLMVQKMYDWLRAWGALS